MYILHITYLQSYVWWLNQMDFFLNLSPPKLAWLIWIVVRRLTRNMARINWMIASWDEVPVMNGVGGVIGWWILEYFSRGLCFHAHL